MVDLDRRHPPTEFTERLSRHAVRILEASNVSAFRISRGRVGGSIHGLPVVLLSTTGRKTGRRRVKPLLAFPDAGSWCVIASRGGSREHPHWYLNLRAWGEGGRSGGSTLAPPTLEVPGADVPVEVDVHVLEGDERARAWEEMAERYPRFDAYRDRGIDREIPVVRLSPH